MKTGLNRSLALAASGLLSLAVGLLAEMRESEAQASRQLVQTLNARDYVSALQILHVHGVTNTTLEAMAEQLVRGPRRQPLQEPFMKGFLLIEEGGGGHRMVQRVWDAASIGYPQPVWVMEGIRRDFWREQAYKEWSRNLYAPIGVMNPRSADEVLRYFKWYNQYAERLHSVNLNWYRLNNFDATNHAEAFAVLNALFQLVKARNPDAFVWLLVEPTVDNSDLRWLQTMRFGYDGLFVGNLRNFTSRFATARQRYVAVVGDSVPMVLTGFYGYEEPLVKAGLLRKGRARAMIEIGQLLAPQLDRYAQKVAELGYRGLIVDWRVIEAVARAQGVPMLESKTPQP